jgi:hypothetical protein
VRPEDRHAVIPSDRSTPQVRFPTDR